MNRFVHFQLVKFKQMSRVALYLGINSKDKSAKNTKEYREYNSPTDD